MNWKMATSPGPCASLPIPPPHSTRFSARCKTCGPLGEFDPEAATHLFRIAQEAIQNAIRHGGATAIEIALDFAGHEAALAIFDNGSGLPDPVSAKLPRGMGWKIMHHRAALLGGAISFVPGHSGRGLGIRCTFPHSSTCSL